MIEHPILFNNGMVRSILDDRKTQTRRVIKPQPNPIPVSNWFLSVDGFIWWDGGENFVRCPYGKLGDRLWVKETWNIHTNDLLFKSGDFVAFQADGDEIDKTARWKPSIHMPRWASRITLEIVNMRAERVQEIGEEDAVAEGLEPKEPNHVVSACYRFVQLWNSINAKRGYGWDVNPWVWVIEFKRLP